MQLCRTQSQRANQRTSQPNNQPASQLARSLQNSPGNSAQLKSTQLGWKWKWQCQQAGTNRSATSAYFNNGHRKPSPWNRAPLKLLKDLWRLEAEVKGNHPG
ncbi:uncharacterized protein LOC108108889 [Drosophila eugracilis]|uniref:uncharacterized protein LOC108108889 n=1 Tax=Drosophila eugracilis TaxID=29029 RepID=UPI0007E6E462|nr:uncharacterized protein LOC108108889 [Drosophila eugracilis]